MTSKPSTIGRLEDTSTLWCDYCSVAAMQAVADVYSQFLVKTGGNEQAASHLTQAWALLVNQDFPGRPPENFTRASLKRWADERGLT